MTGLLLNVSRIVSGGQTGADRAALDWAIAHGIDHGGWCPRGRRAEDGIIPLQYRLAETPTRSYAERTRWNVRDSDATVIFSIVAELGGGSLYTQKLTLALGRPALHLHVPKDAAARALRDFLIAHRVTVLNIAGPRASTEPAIGEYVAATLDTLLGLCY